MPSPADVFAAQQTLIAALQNTSFESADAVLVEQLKAVDDWEATVGDFPALVATAQVARAQLQAQQRMLEVLRRESESISEALRQAALAMGGPPAAGEGE